MQARMLARMQARPVARMQAVAKDLRTIMEELVEKIGKPKSYFV
jgi:hypothetical protein